VPVDRVVESKFTLLPRDPQVVVRTGTQAKALRRMVVQLPVAKEVLEAAAIMLQPADPAATADYAAVAVEPGVAAPILGVPAGMEATGAYS